MWSIFRPDAVRVLTDKKARRSLKRYFSVMQDKLPAKFMIAKRLSAFFHEDDSMSELWTEHDRLTEDFQRFEERVDSRLAGLKDQRTPKKSYLDLKVEIARRMMENCHFCTRRCGVNRWRGEHGYCRCGGGGMFISSIFPHTGEEPELVPSGTIFTLGCTMKCLHCQNWSISQWLEKGEPFTPEEAAREVDDLRKRGCRNVNLVGGEPTPWLFHWLETFRYVETNVPVVWNSNSYYSEETMRLLTGFADVYLLDFKYGDDKCAERISNAPRYWKACTRNHLYAKTNGELIIRVLVLPGHIECCTRRILNWIGENLGTWVRVNVMFQYRPEWRAHELPELRRRLTWNEREKAIELAKETGLTNFIT